MRMISKPVLHITPIHGNRQSNLLPIHSSIHMRMTPNPPNRPRRGNLGKLGTTGANPTTLHSQRESGRTIRSPTLQPTKRANGLITPNNPIPRTPHTTPPLVPSRHSLLNPPPTIEIQNVIIDDPDRPNPGSPHFPQGMYPWIFMVAAQLNGKRLSSLQWIILIGCQHLVRSQMTNDQWLQDRSMKTTFVDQWRKSCPLTIAFHLIMLNGQQSYFTVRTSCLTMICLVAMSWNSMRPT